MERAVPGSPVMNPYPSSVFIIWLTDEGETCITFAISDSAGG